MRLILATIFFIITLGAEASVPKGYKISGEAEGLSGRMVYLACTRGGFQIIDSAKIVDGKYLFEGDSIITDRYFIRCRPHSVDLILEPGADIHIKEFNRNKIEIRKGGEQLLLNQYYNFLPELELDERSFVLRESKRVEYILHNPKGMAAIVAAAECLMPTYKQMETIFSLIDTISYRHTYTYKDLVEKRKALAGKWMVGKTAPGFTAQSIDGKSINLSQFRGEYLLLDFWASWCAPCREKGRVIAKNIDKLKALGITVISLSMDDDKTRWMDASEKDGITWMNLSDLRGLKNSSIAADYRVTSVSRFFLIDPNGYIVSQDPSLYDILKGNLSPESDVDWK